MSYGVEIKKYCTDNGVYTSKEFIDEIKKNNQSIRFSGVGGNHHNGVAENAIGNVMKSGRAIMVHDALRWSKCDKKNLWPLEISHSTYLHNNIPNM